MIVSNGPSATPEVQEELMEFSHFQFHYVSVGRYNDYNASLKLKKMYKFILMSPLGLKKSVLCLLDCL